MVAMAQSERHWISKRATRVRFPDSRQGRGLSACSRQDSLPKSVCDISMREASVYEIQTTKCGLVIGRWQIAGYNSDKWHLNNHSSYSRRPV